MKQIENADVQYNDLKGTVALDFHGGIDGEFHSYAEKKGIDINRYHPIGLKFYIGEMGGFYLSFYCVDNEVKEVFSEEHNGKIPIVIFEKEETLTHFLNEVKRLEVVLTSDTIPAHEIYKTYDNDNKELEN